MTRVSPITAFGLREIEIIAGRPIDTANARSALLGLETYGYPKLGLNRPHRLAQFMAQVMHESARFKYDREIWGPTPAQKRYDTRTDLGNTAAADGDGYLYRGRAGIQITGKSNYQQFTAWCKARFANAPDFVKTPDAVNTDPWEGLAAIWYWETRNLNTPTDAGDTNRVTKIINGGQNGLTDRRNLYVRAGLVLLGYGPNDVTRFQMDRGLTADGVAGPATHRALHNALVLAKPLSHRAPAPAKPGLAPTTTGGIVGVISAIIGAIVGYFMNGGAP
jgi:putative chitinase